MSWRTIYNPRRLLSRDTADAIRATGVDLDNYASNIEQQLLAAGRDDLVKLMIDEIGMSNDEIVSRRDSSESTSEQDAYDRRHGVGRYLN